MMPSLLLLVALATPAEATRRPSVYVGDWVPRSEGEIASFCRRYDRVDGDLVIGPGYPAESLRPLGCLEGVSGTVRIRKAPLLKSLDGIETLAGVDALDLAGLHIVGNPVLEDVSALGRLGDLGVRSILLAENKALVSIRSLPAILPGGSFVLRGNDRLGEVEGPRGASADTTLAVVRIEANPALVEVRGLGSIATVEQLVVTGNPSLQSLDVLPGLRAAPQLVLSDNPSLARLPVWPSLAHVGSWTVSGMSSLEALPPYADLSRVKELSIRQNASLTDISGLAANRATPPTIYSARITGNPVLPEDTVALVLGRIQTFREGGTWEIAGNGVTTDPD